MISGMRVRRRSSAGAASGYRFYRLWVTAIPTGGTDFVSLRELRLLSGVENVALRPGGTASASTSRTNGNPPNAFDDETSFWGSATGAGFPQWIQIELAAPAAIDTYEIWVTNLSNTQPIAFELRASKNGLTWVTLDAQSGLTWVSNETKSFPLT